jgi:hypothetical protein
MTAEKELVNYDVVVVIHGITLVMDQS